MSEATEPHPESREALIQKIGNIIDNAWKGKNAKLEEWLRDEESARKNEIRIEEAEYSGVVKLEDQPWYGNVAMFYSTRTTNPFNVSARLAPKGLKPGELVNLTVLGCCNILAIERVKSKSTQSKPDVRNNKDRRNKKGRSQGRRHDKRSRRTKD